jgi:chaperonin GroEL
MNLPFSFSVQIEKNLQTLTRIYDCLKITLGPTGKNALLAKTNQEVKVLSSGFFILKSLDFVSSEAKLLTKLIEQAAGKTAILSGDGSTTTSLFLCDVIQRSIRYLTQGYHSISLSHGFQKLGFFVSEKVFEHACPVQTPEDLQGILRTSIGKKLNTDLFEKMTDSVSQLGRDGLVLVEENTLPFHQVENVQGIELEKGYASSYFINQVKSFEVIYSQPFLLLPSHPLRNVQQLREVIEYTQSLQRPLIIVTEEITKEVLSNLVLLTLQKKAKLLVIHYRAIQFVKTGILEDLASLTYASYTAGSGSENAKKGSSLGLENFYSYSIQELGQAEKVISQKEKTTFLVSKFSKFMAKRRMNELHRELIMSETDYEKTLLKTRIARLSGNIIKLKIASSNAYQIEEERQKVENAIATLKSSLEEGLLPGGGSFYFYLRNELKTWASMNLVGEEYFAAQIFTQSLLCPLKELAENTNTAFFQIFPLFSESAYPYAYDFVQKKWVQPYHAGLIDSAKSVRAVLWNTLSLVSTIVTSE